MIHLTIQMEVLIMQLLEFIKMLAEADWKEVLVGMIHPVYGPMIIITAFLLLLDDIQKLFGKH